MSRLGGQLNYQQKESKFFNINDDDDDDDDDDNNNNNNNNNKNTNDNHTQLKDAGVTTSTDSRVRHQDSVLYRTDLRGQFKARGKGTVKWAHYS